MFFLVKNPFYKLTNLSDDLMKILIKDLPYIKEKILKKFIIKIINMKLIEENWENLYIDLIKKN